MPEKRKYADRREYLIRAVSKIRKRLKVMAIAYKGGKCILCGYCACEQSLVFHHVDKEMKNFNLSFRGFTRSWESIKKELDKCEILCANCHGEIHAGIKMLPQ